jgi:hypothetical protein
VRLAVWSCLVIVVVLSGSSRKNKNIGNWKRKEKSGEPSNPASGTIGPPSLPTASQICPNPNWTVQLVSITYFNVVLHIQQQGSDILTYNFGTVDP